MKKYFGGLITGFLLFACGSSPSVIERRLNVASMTLLGSKPEWDLPISQANGHYCYSEDDTVEVKKYIITLEQRLKECQQNCRK